MFLKIFYQFVKEYGDGYKFKLFRLTLYSIFMGFFEFMGIAMIFPFVIFLSGDKSFLNIPHIKAFLDLIKIGDADHVLPILSILIVSIYILKDVFMVYYIRYQSNLIADWQYSIYSKTLRNLIYAPYLKLSKLSFGEQSTLLGGALNASLWGFVHKVILLGSNLIIALFILGFLFYKFPAPAFFTSIFLITFVLVEQSYFKKKAKQFGSSLLKVTKIQGSLFQYIMKGIKEIKVSKNRDFFVNGLEENYRECNTNVKLANLNGQYPVYITEIGIIISFVMLTCLILYMQKINSNFLLFSLAVVAAVILRLLPVLNKLQSTMYSINQSRSSILWFLETARKFNLNEKEPECADIPYDNKIMLRNVDFSYNGNEPILKDINLEIKKGEFVGIVGLSGAGKTTLMDILTGLNYPTKGNMYIDDIEISKNNVRAWHRKISILPQDFFLMPVSILQNVCFGEKEEQMDVEKAIYALKKANIYENIENLNDTANFSHGQKHRIALARAFYQNADVLFLDEATASLDIETEDKVAKSIADLKGEKTIIAIAHRLSTLKECDYILYMKDGKIMDKGSFLELKEKYPDFENMIKLSSFIPQ